MCLGPGSRLPDGLDLLAPPLLWSEVTSALHAARWHAAITEAQASAARAAFSRLPVHRRAPPELHDEAWRLADELGLAKTHDAEFLALAALEECRVLTADARLHRAGRRRGLTVDPLEIAAELS
jgi:predicted nucleic acid-binding protein